MFSSGENDDAMIAPFNIEVINGNLEAVDGKAIVLLLLVCNLPQVTFIFYYEN